MAKPTNKTPLGANRTLMQPKDLLENAYRAFNSRDIDGALALMHPDVEWPNGMEGGMVHGHDGVRAYWTRQWGLIDPHVEPIGITSEAGLFVVEVHTVVKDLSGAVLADGIVHHAYRIEGGKIRFMEIRE